MNRYVKGALVYIPAGAKLYKLSSGGAVERYKTMSKPTNVLFIGKREPYHDILYEGERWSVPVDDVYPSRRVK